MNVVRERRTKSTFSNFVTNLKFRIKIFVKALVNSRQLLPGAAIGFEKITEAYLRNSKNIYNRFEGASFKWPLKEAELVEYPASQSVLNGLPVEGEKNKPYRLKNAHIAVTPEVMGYSLSNAGIVGSEGFIYDRHSNRFIDETLRQWFTWDSRLINSYLSSFRPFTPTFIKGVTLSICKPGADSYYHFLHEALPAFLLLKDQYPSLPIENLIVSGGHAGFKEEWLTLAGIGNTRVYYTSYDTHFVCDQLLFLSDLCYQYSPNTLTVNLLKNIQVPNAESGFKTYPKAIIASRKNAKTRTIDWEEELVAKTNATIVEFDKLSPAAAVSLCRHCEVFMGPHGAAFSNIVFCKPGTEIIELAFGTDEVLYSRLAKVCNQTHLIFDTDKKRELFAYINNRFKNNRC